jgi:PilZ domain
MASPERIVDQRKHPRAQLKLAARIRWQGPLGMRVEMVQTVDVSREGVLIHRNEMCEVSSRVWIIFPYDRAAGSSAQPETPARIARVARDENGGYWVALRMETPLRTSPRSADHERRQTERITFSLPIFVRVDGTPWPEESMTQDVSHKGVRFETSHIYAPGDTVFAKIPWGEWSIAGEVRGRVLRVENMEDRPGPVPLSDPRKRTSAIFTSVAIEWTNGGMNKDAQPAKV